MFHAVNLETLRGMHGVHRSMFMDRAQQFVTRHRWPLELQPTGFEVDAFDDALTTYCVVEDGGLHHASLRLRSAEAGSMVERHFPELWRGALTRLVGKTEVTRFCASPALSPDLRLSSVSDLLLGLCRHSQRSGAETFFGVVFPTVARVIKQSGWPPTIIGEMHDPSGLLLLAEWTASERVAWNIQECRELREESWSERRAASVQLVA